MNADFYKLVRTLESLTEEKPETKKLENGKSVLKESSITEMDKSQPSGDRGGESSGDPNAKGGKAEPVKFKDMTKHAEKTLNQAMDNANKKNVKKQQQGVTEAAKWRDPKYRGVSFDYDDSYEGPGDARPGKLPLTRSGQRDLAGSARMQDPLAAREFYKKDTGKITTQDIEDTRDKNFGKEWYREGQGVAESERQPGRFSGKWQVLVNGEKVLSFRGQIDQETANRIGVVKAADRGLYNPGSGDKIKIVPVMLDQKQDVAEGSLEEVAPPGAKAERMVKHIKAGYAKDGKLTDVEKRKAYGAAWKAHNKGQVEEGEVWRPGMPPPPNPDMGSSLPPREQRRVVTPQGPDGVQQPHLPTEPKKPQPKRSEIGMDTDVAETAKQKDKKSDRLPIYQESLRYKTINKLIREEFDLRGDEDRMSIEEKDLQSSLGDELFNQLQAVQNGEAEMSESLKDALFNFYKSSGELPPEITKDEQDVNDYIMNKIQSISSNDNDDRLPMSEDTKHKGTRYGGSAQVDDEDDEDGEAKSKVASTEKRGRGRPRKDSGDANTNAKYSGAKDLQSMIVGNVPKKSKSLEKLSATKHKLKGEEQ